MRIKLLNWLLRRRPDIYDLLPRRVWVWHFLHDE